MSHVTKSYVTCRIKKNVHVALLNLGVKGHVGGRRQVIMKTTFSAVRDSTPTMPIVQTISIYTDLKKTSRGDCLWTGVSLFWDIFIENELPREWM